MKTAPLPLNEAERLFALRALQLLDTPSEERFDRITRIVSNALDVPIATISLLDDTRQWFKSAQGLCATETPRDQAFCAHAIMQPAMLVIPDATRDDRFHNNPLVTGEPHIRFYAGQPITLHNTLLIGTLCAIDTKPRILEPHHRAILTDLAAIVESEIAAMSQSQRAYEQRKRI